MVVLGDKAVESELMLLNLEGARRAFRAGGLEESL
jgi:hypothetical protein